MSETTLKPAVLLPAFEALVSEISERCYCASWMSGIEEDIELAIESDKDYRYGQSEITTEEIAALREFKRLGVWFDTKADGSTVGGGE